MTSTTLYMYIYTSSMNMSIETFSIEYFMTRLVLYQIQSTIGRLMFCWSKQPSSQCSNRLSNNPQHICLYLSKVLQNLDVTDLRRIKMFQVNRSLNGFCLISKYIYMESIQYTCNYQTQHSFKHQETNYKSNVIVL